MTMDDVTIKIPRGTILIRQGSCPNGCSLMNPQKQLSGKPAISANVKARGLAGQIHFNPYYGIFDYDTDLNLSDEDTVDLYCPKCQASLAVEEQCNLCHVPMFAIQLPKGGEIRACPRVGCQNHHLTILDLDAQFAEFYNEERRPKM